MPSTLPKELLVKQKARAKSDLAADISETARWLAEKAASAEYMGANKKPYLVTLSHLAECVDRMDAEFAADFFLPEQPNLRSLSGWKEPAEVA